MSNKETLDEVSEAKAKLEKLKERHKKEYKVELKITPIGVKAGKQMFKIVSNFAVFGLSAASGLNNPEFVKMIIETLMAHWPKKPNKIEKIIGFRKKNPKPKFPSPGKNYTVKLRKPKNNFKN